MKTVVICDSGLGGLDVAARCCTTAGNGSCNIVFFNAWPAIGIGYNKLTSAEQQRVFAHALEGMAAFSPERVVIACNTLSIIWESMRERVAMPFPVTGIIDVAVSGMLNYLAEDPRRMLWILGTKTTIESKVYYNRLVAAGISQERLREIPCPGLATLIEQNPESRQVSEEIKKYADLARLQVAEGPASYGVAFCCTHFGYAETVWQREFFRAMGKTPTLLNPNGWFTDLEPAAGISYHARIPFADDAQECMACFFDHREPMVAQALRSAHINQNLFNPHIGETFL